MTAFVWTKRMGLLAVGMWALGSTVAAAESARQNIDTVGGEATFEVAALASASSSKVDVAPLSPTGFARLPPSGQMIAQALFEAQGLSVGRASTESWSLDRIAAERRSGLGWGQVFRAMKARGLIDARTLSEAISMARYLEPGGAYRTRYADVSVSLGYGHTVLVGQAETVGRGTRPSAPVRTDRIELGRLVVSDFDRGVGGEGRRYAPLIGAVRIYRD